MTKRFTKIYGEALWRSKRFLAASDKAKLVYIYLLSNPHSTRSGHMRSRTGTLSLTLDGPSQSTGPLEPSCQRLN